ncbi:helix-turn-helix domain-containing protein [Pedobacter frigoris]|uniref:Helix-turn-helix transcriptional regulator n=1 Tax=Pedobacter frigoris TaxID=2571272 RepID=A0A4U1CM13_9SPHI|nr:helix-turn-helix transcriptional regulator [Pedobacter frigoris]TKC08887.1 helix-turn-helix transcriptional regulator [Pedobacter frigoris]
MSSIQNINLLETLLSAEQLFKLDKAAARHQEQSNTNFDIHSLENKNIEIETTQGETSSGKYASETTLIKRTEDLFRKHLPDYKIIVSARTFQVSPSSVVNNAWIDKMMQQKGIRIKQIAFDTGIDRESISDWVTGKRSMSQIVKAMFYFYLK